MSGPAAAPSSVLAVAEGEERDGGWRWIASSDVPCSATKIRSNKTLIKE